MHESTYTFELVAAFLHALEAEGYPIGTGAYLNIQEVMTQLPEDISDDALRDSLIPILATNEQEQHLFRSLFKRAQRQVKTLRVESDMMQQGSTKRSRIGFFFFLLLGILLSFLIFFGPQLWRSELEPTYYHFSLKPGQLDQVVAPDSAMMKGLRPPVRFSLPQKQNNKLPSYLLFEIEEGGEMVKFRAPDSSVVDTLELTLEGTGRYYRTVFLIGEVAPVIETGEEQLEIAVLPQRSIEDQERSFKEPLLRAQELPYASDIRTLEFTPPPKLSSFFARHWRWIRWVLILLTAQLVMLWIRWREESRQAIVASKEQRTKPPYVWPIRLPGLKEWITLDDHFQKLLTKMRRRARDEQKKLDIGATVNATLKQGGMVRFAYSSLTRPPEYLMLIDRQTGRNHQAELYDYLYQALQRQDVLIERFFFQGDLRACSNEMFPQGIGLRDLHHRFPEARVLIISDGGRLLNLRTGSVSRWVSRLLNNWKAYALLTPKPVNSWGKKERRLRQLMPVVPATLQSMSFLADQWAAQDEADFSQWPAYVQDATQTDIVLDDSLMRTLAQSYDEVTLQWIAGCAIYPELQWDLTLLMGKTLSTEDRNLLHLTDLQHLLRLPWFQEGEMPEAVRLVLLDWLSQQYPQVESLLRKTLLETVQNQEPPVDSVAYEPFRLQMAFNAWRTTPSADRKRELEQWLEQEDTDMVIARFLDGEPGMMDMVLPDRFRKFAFRGGHKKWASGKSQRDLRFASMLWLGLSIASFAVNPTVTTCDGTKKTYLIPSITQPYDSVAIIGEDGATYELLAVSHTDSVLIMRNGPGLVRYWLPGELMTPLDLPSQAVQAITFPGRSNVLPGAKQTLPDDAHLFSFLVIQNQRLWGVIGNSRGYQTVNLSRDNEVADVATYQLDRIPVAYQDGRVQLINSKGNVLAMTRHDGVEHIAAPYFNGGEITTVSRDSSIVVWDKTALTEKTRWQLPYPAQELHMSWNGDYVATAGNGLVHVWSIRGELIYTSHGTDIINVLANTFTFRQAGQVFTRQFTYDQTVTKYVTGTSDYAFAGSLGQIFSINPEGTHIFRWGSGTIEPDGIDICLFNALDSAMYIEHRSRQFAFHGQLDSLDTYMKWLSELSISDSLYRARTANVATVLYNRALQAVVESDTTFACVLMDWAVAIDRGRSPLFIQAQEAICLSKDKYQEMQTEVVRTATVVDANTGSPLRDVQVQSDLGNFKTNRNGQFEIQIPQNRESGTFNLFFNKEGYQPQQQSLANRETMEVIQLTPVEQESKLQISKNGRRFGLKDGDEFVLKPAYQRIEADAQSGYFRLWSPENKGIARVGMADPQGKVVVPVEYQLIRFPRSGLMAAQNYSSGRWGYLDAVTGEVQIDFDHDEAESFLGETASVSSLGNRYFIDRFGLCVQNCPEAVLIDMLEAYLLGRFPDMEYARDKVSSHVQLTEMLTAAISMEGGDTGSDFFKGFYNNPETLKEMDPLVIDRLQELLLKTENLPYEVRVFLKSFINSYHSLQISKDISEELPPIIADILPEMRSVAGGTFLMGCTEKRRTQCEAVTLPAHEVTVQPFLMSKYEVTNRQFVVFLRNMYNRVDDIREWYDPDKGRIQGDKYWYEVPRRYSEHPVTGVTWQGAKAFANWLASITGNNYRLPTEAEWEFAARGGNGGGLDNFSFAGSNRMDQVGWYAGNSPEGTHVVGQKEANQLGVYDMSGNVWEWMEDCWFDNYNEAPQNSEARLGNDKDCFYRVRRGGGWDSESDQAKVIYRKNGTIEQSDEHTGFRLVSIGRVSKVDR